MPVKNGLVRKGDHGLEVVCCPISAYQTRCYWVNDDQTGPFDSLWIYGAPENESLLDRQFLDVPECHKGRDSLWNRKPA